MKKSWCEKLADDKALPKVCEIRAGRGICSGKSRMVIAALAKKHQTNFACPIKTGIFSRVAPYAAAEKEAEGKKRITPFWRTLKMGGEVNPKYPGGIAAIANRLHAEGHKIAAKGKRTFVSDYEQKLFTKLR